MLISAHTTHARNTSYAEQSTIQMLEKVARSVENEQIERPNLNIFMQIETLLF